MTAPDRKLFATLAADIAGYSALMGADEESPVRDLKASLMAAGPDVIREVGPNQSLGDTSDPRRFSHLDDRPIKHHAIGTSVTHDAFRHDLEHLLCEAGPDGGKLSSWTALSGDSSSTITLRHFDACEAAVHLINRAPSQRSTAAWRK